MRDRSVIGWNATECRSASLARLQLDLLDGAHPLLGDGAIAAVDISLPGQHLLSDRSIDYSASNEVGPE